MFPSLIYGIATGKLVELGLQNPYSIQIPALIDASLARGQGGMVGEGKNIWVNVHIEDGMHIYLDDRQSGTDHGNTVADLYIDLYNAILANPDKVGHGREGIYFGENGELRFYDISKAVAQALVDAGKGKSPEPTPFTKEELHKYFGVGFFLST